MKKSDIVVGGIYRTGSGLVKVTEECKRFDDDCVKYEYPDKSCGILTRALFAMWAREKVEESEVNHD